MLKKWFHGLDLYSGEKPFERLNDFKVQKVYIKYKEDKYKLLTAFLKSSYLRLTIDCV